MIVYRELHVDKSRKQGNGMTGTDACHALKAGEALVQRSTRVYSLS
jgi:hypothetical protein